MSRPEVATDACKYAGSVPICSLKIAVTGRCDLACAHCGAPPSKMPELTTRDILRVAGEAREVGAGCLLLTGGEPLLRSDIPDIVQGAWELGYETVQVETNGMHIDRLGLERLARRGRVLGVGVSLDGAADDEHDRFRGVRGAFRRTRRGLETLADCDFVGLTVVTVLNALNKGSIEHIVDYAVTQLGAEHRLLHTVAPVGRGQACRHRLSPSEALGFMEGSYIPFYRRWLNENGSAPFHADLPLALCPPDINFPPAVCNWARGVVGVTADGEVGLCHDAGGIPALLAGNVREASFAELFVESPTFQMLRSLDASDIQGVCGNCLALPVCRGRCRVAAIQVYGDILAPDPVCQEYYDAGLFPAYALLDPDRDASFHRERASLSGR